MRDRTGLTLALTTALLLGLAGASTTPALADEAEGAAPYGVGDAVEAFTLEDQHGATASVDASTRVVLFSRDMEGGELLKAALEDATAEALEARGAVYVSDISGMPALVARLFALPAMRRRPYDMLLDRDGTTTARLPDVEGRATLIHLAAGRIERIHYAADADTIRTSLGLALQATP